jgi:hypothetical protein
MSEYVLRKILGDIYDVSNNIRWGRMDDGEYRFSVFDFMTRACDYKDNGAAAKTELARLMREGSEFKDDIESVIHYHKFPGTGQRMTPVMRLRGLQTLMVILGFKVAAVFRHQVDEALSRVMCGEASLVDEINAKAAKAASNGQVQCKESILQEKKQAVQKKEDDGAAGEVDADTRKRALEQADFNWKMEMAERQVKWKMEMAERQESLMQMKAETQSKAADAQGKAADAQGKAADAQGKALDAQKLMMAFYADLCPNKEIDETGKLVFKKNLMALASQTLSQSAAGAASANNKPAPFADDGCGWQ